MIDAGMRRIRSTRSSDSRLARRLAIVFWLGVLLAGLGACLWDHIWGPRDDVIYLWPFLVVPLMFTAAVVVITHACIFVVGFLWSYAISNLMARRSARCRT